MRSVERAGAHFGFSRGGHKKGDGSASDCARIEGPQARLCRAADRAGAWLPAHARERPAAAAGFGGFEPGGSGQPPDRVRCEDGTGGSSGSSQGGSGMGCAGPGALVGRANRGVGTRISTGDQPGRNQCAGAAGARGTEAGNRAARRGGARVRSGAETPAGVSRRASGAGQCPGAEGPE